MDVINPPNHSLVIPLYLQKEKLVGAQHSLVSPLPSSAKSPQLITSANSSHRTQNKTCVKLIEELY